MSIEPPDGQIMHDADFFATHGFCVWRGLLEPAEVEGLRREVDDALAANYALPAAPVPHATGTEGYYVPMMGDRTPLSRELLAGRLLPAAVRLLGTPVLPKPAKGILYRDSSPWHQDSADASLTAVKMVAYLEPLTAADGALQVLPGSHRGRYGRALAEYRRRWPAAEPLFDERAEAAMWPGVPVTTNPGDVIAFDVHLWHASIGGRDRRQWSVSYAAEPADEAGRSAVRDYLLSFLDVGHPYDLDTYPYFDPEWAHPPRPAFADRMAELLSSSPVPGRPTVR
ncbi:hypothetical protein HD597_003595 [Nonomuraea thailandensis]|uniref:Phytanoyl-CoA dioxygenase family protein n=1 Tax=Nonomuraea thailandensis TaxID=1188745 RepID=A0A9X2K213_9ACTN|nr:phytanoyl-CoA dioxygenase family protein [Nonomuraea thailandensis]MCP2356575.1 hypothetical protein [Nonomuraea thailandensis]